MTHTEDLDVIICGAGAAGLTLAIDLARRGVGFQLIEKMPEPFAGSRGKGIQPRTQEVFEDLGILDQVAAAGGPYPAVRRYRADGGYADTEVMEGTMRTPAEPYAASLMVPQFATEAAMRRRLLELGHRPEFGWELVGIEQDQDGVTARVVGKAGQETLRVRWLIGADGGRSFVRHALDIGFPGKTLGVRAVVADVMLTGLSRDVWHQFGDGDMARQIFLCPLAGTKLFQLQGPVALDGDADLSPEGLAAMVALRTGRRDIHIHWVSWASAYSMSARLADRYRMDRIFLVGDACHIHPPTGGQGLNTSVQDAYNLGWKLAAVTRGAPDSLLDSYEEERRPVAAAVLGLATSLLHSQKDGQMRRGRQVHQLDIAYPTSSLAMGRSRSAGGLSSGDRAPDATLLDAAGRSIRLFDKFKGGHWTLLGYHAYGGAVRPRPGLHIHVIAPHGDLLDDQQHVEEAYAPSIGEWVLVRPDGYIGAIVQGSELADLEVYLTRVGLGLDNPAGQFAVSDGIC